MVKIKIIILFIILIILAAGGIFIWQYFGAPEEEVKEMKEEKGLVVQETDRAPEEEVKEMKEEKGLVVQETDNQTLLTGFQSDGSQFKILSLNELKNNSEVWARFFNSLGDIPLFIDEPLSPEHFFRFSRSALSPDQKFLAFAIETYERMLSSNSVLGVINLENNEVSLRTYALGDIEQIIWSNTGKYFAATVGTARANGDMILISSPKLFTGPELKMLEGLGIDGNKIATLLNIKDKTHFIPQFRQLRWSFEAPATETLFFKTNETLDQKGEIEWYISSRDNWTGVFLLKLENL